MLVTQLPFLIPPWGKSVLRLGLWIFICRWMSDSNIFFFLQLTEHFFSYTSSLYTPCYCFGMFTYPSYLHILQDQLLCRVLSCPWSWTAVILLTGGMVGTLTMNAHPPSKRRLQLTIVGFHHHLQCSALVLMACQWIFLSPLSLCLSFMASFMPSSS